MNLPKLITRTSTSEYKHVVLHGGRGLRRGDFECKVKKTREFSTGNPFSGGTQSAAKQTKHEGQSQARQGDRGQTEKTTTASTPSDAEMAKGLETSIDMIHMKDYSIAWHFSSDMRGVRRKNGVPMVERQEITMHRQCEAQASTPPPEHSRSNGGKNDCSGQCCNSR